MLEIFRIENKRKWFLFRLRKIEEIFLDECFFGIFVRFFDIFCLIVGV